jgi:hypothetical protein
MASRAHVIYDPTFGSNAALPQRAMRYRDRDPIVLPRSSIWSTGAGLIAVAVAAAAIVGGGAYAAYHTDSATIAETPALPLEREWQPEGANVRAAITNVLSGPMQAAPSRALPTFESDAETPILSGSSDQALIDDSAPAAEPRLPQGTATPATAPDSPATAVPNPTTTPPDAIAPPNSSPETPTPLLDSGNPYR